MKTLKARTTKLEAKATDDSPTDKQPYDKESSEKKMGKCPVCTNYHYYTSKKGKTSWMELASAFFTSCSKYKDATIKQKSTYIVSNRACTKCTDWRHERAACPKKWDKPCRECEGSTIYINA